MDDLINLVDLFWNLDLLNVYVHQNDVSIIRSLVISRHPKQDSYIWNFSKYMVKSGYRTEIFYLDLGLQLTDMGPNTKVFSLFLEV